jgi:catalase
MSDNPVYTTSGGAPVSDPNAMVKIGKFGPNLLQDHHLIDLLSHFDRERIPERVAHAKGAGAHGYFEVTDDVSDICKADFLQGIGKKTPLFTRFSTVGGERGTADTVRDNRGWATKIYTQEGNLDWVNINTPVFFIRNGVQFPFLVHTQKSRDPQTNLKDRNIFWDFLCNNPESLHQTMITFTDRGTPMSYRHMNTYSGHTYKWENKNGDWHYVQIHIKTDQGVKNWNNEQATALTAENPDYATQDLFDAIERGEYPSWTVYVQTMTPEQAKNAPFSVFDLTKVWPHADYPLRRFGKIVYNRNPENYFAEVEQSGFTPANTVPGIQPSADPVLQARLFSYADTQRYRLGVNYQQYPINKPLRAFCPFQRDGAAAVNGNYGKLPNYPSSLQPINYQLGITLAEHQEVWEGPASVVHWGATEEDFVQPRALLKVLERTGQRDALVHNVAVDAQHTKPVIQDRIFEYFSRADPQLGQDIRTATLQLNPRH